MTLKEATEQCRAAAHLTVKREAWPHAERLLPIFERVEHRDKFVLNAEGQMVFDLEIEESNAVPLEYMSMAGFPTRVVIEDADAVALDWVVGVHNA